MAVKPFMNLLLLLVIALAASSKSFAHAEAVTITTSMTKEQLALDADMLRNLKDSTKETDDEDSYDEERMLSLNKLKALLQRKPDAAVTLGKNSGLGKALAGNSDPAYVRANSQVRSYFSANPTMTRGLELYQIDYMIAIVSLFVSFGALGVLIAMMAQRSN